MKTIIAVKVGKDGRSEFHVESSSDAECARDAEALEAVLALLGLRPEGGTRPVRPLAVPEGTQAGVGQAKKVRNG